MLLKGRIFAFKIMRTAIYLTIGALCLFRGVYRSTRALVKTGSIRRCEGTNSFGVCDPSVGVATSAGEPVFSVARGEVVASGSDFIHIRVFNERVVLMYAGLQPVFAVGDRVAIGQSLGKSSGMLSFSVTGILEKSVEYISPTAWLAARGFRVVEKNSGSELWCSTPRVVHVPKSACALKEPEKAGFALLPVDIEVES